MHRRNCQLRFVAFAILVCFSAKLVRAADIDSCKYLVVTDFTSDPYGIAQELRTQGRAEGFAIVSDIRELSDSEKIRACVMAGSWSAGGMGGNVEVRVVDMNGGLIAEAAASGTDWWSVKRTVRGVVKRLYTQLGYKGYSDVVLQERLQRLYPPRPSLAITESQIRATEPHSPVEGIWSDPENKYWGGWPSLFGFHRLDYD